MIIRVTTHSDIHSQTLTVVVIVVIISKWLPHVEGGMSTNSRILAGFGGF